MSIYSRVPRIVAGFVGLILAGVVLSACGCGSGSFTSPAGSMAQAKFAYTTNLKTGDISGYAVDPVSGALTPLSGFPIPSGVNPISVIHDPLNHFVIVADTAANLVRVYGINPITGMLVEVLPSPYLVGPGPRSLAIDPTGRFIYVGSQSQNSVTAFSMNAAGVLTPVPGSPFATGGDSPSFGCCVVIDPTGKFVFAEDLTNVYSFAIDTSTGKLTLITTISGPRQGDGLAVDPRGTFLYAVGAGLNSVETFAINSTTGAITLASTSPLALQNGAYTIIIHPSGQFAYTVENGQNLVAYSVQNGMLTSLNSPYSGALGSLQLALDPTGTFIYAPQTGTVNSVSGFRINASGTLSELPGSPTASGQWPFSMTITSQ